LEALRLKVCERHGWNDAQWHALPPAEREEKLAFEQKRQQRIEKLLERLSSGENVSLEQITAHTLIAIMREL